MLLKKWSRQKHVSNTCAVNIEWGKLSFDGADLELRFPHSHVKPQWRNSPTSSCLSETWMTKVAICLKYLQQRYFFDQCALQWWLTILNSFFLKPWCVVETWDIKNVVKLLNYLIEGKKRLICYYEGIWLSGMGVTRLGESRRLSLQMEWIQCYKGHSWGDQACQMQEKMSVTDLPGILLMRRNPWWDATSCPFKSLWLPQANSDFASMVQKMSANWTKQAQKKPPNRGEPYNWWNCW